MELEKKKKKKEKEAEQEWDDGNLLEKQKKKKEERPLSKQTDEKGKKKSDHERRRREYKRDDMEDGRGETESRTPNAVVPLPKPFSATEKSFLGNLSSTETRKRLAGVRPSLQQGRTLY